MISSETDVFLTREEPIKKLERIVLALSEAIKLAGIDRDQGRNILREALSARCLGCGIAVTGDELIELPEVPAKAESSRIKLLRDGKCANAECKSPLYELIIQRHADLNWQNIFSPPESDEQKQIKQELAEAEALKTARRASLWRAARLALLVLIAILLWVWRQYYIGGTIPFLREPENFQAHAAPTAAPPPHH